MSVSGSTPASTDSGARQAPPPPNVEGIRLAREMAENPERYSREHLTGSLRVILTEFDNMAARVAWLAAGGHRE